ncbi:MAG: glycosyltransferase, partial [Leptolyngbya sp. SIO4C1]|nr:glycosyltransferase [Leptolyngbya sp. SIO4C1]
HDGIDTTFFQPNPKAHLTLPSLGLDLSHAQEIITYVARGLEPYRGFPQAMEAIALIQQRRPHCHAVIVGEDRAAYGKPLPEGQTYKQLMLDKLSLDESRLHFTGRLPYDQYLQVLQVSSAHIYLTRPFVLSWSMLEAMATGCALVASNTAPVREVVRNGHNGLLVDFFSPTAIANLVETVLENHDFAISLRTHARETILQQYNLAALLPQHINWLAAGSARKRRSATKFKGFVPSRGLKSKSAGRHQPVSLTVSLTERSVLPTPVRDQKLGSLISG